MLPSPPCTRHSVSCATAEGTRSVTKSTRTTRTTNDRYLWRSASLVSEPIQLRRILPQDRASDFGGTGAGDFSVTHHVRERDGECFARGLRGDPSRLLPADRIAHRC